VGHGVVEQVQERPPDRFAIPSAFRKIALDAALEAR
jgi:hypothetical protein